MTGSDCKTGPVNGHRSKSSNGGLSIPPLHEAAKGYIKDTFEEAYGFVLCRENFRDILTKDGKALKTVGLWIDVKQSEEQVQARWIGIARVVAVVILRRQRKKEWYLSLLELATHRVALPVTYFIDDASLSLESGPDFPRYDALFVDSRYEQRAAEKLRDLPTPHRQVQG